MLIPPTVQGNRLDKRHDFIIFSRKKITLQVQSEENSYINMLAPTFLCRLKKKLEFAKFCDNLHQ